MTLLDKRDQSQISKQFPMPVDDTSTSSSIQTVSGETVALYYSNAGTRTIDAGQAAGTPVQGNIALKNILSVGGGQIASYQDTSLAFTGNCFTTEIQFPVHSAEAIKEDTWLNKLTKITESFANGEYCVDYRSGDIYGRKATTTSSLTSTTYKVNQAQSGGSSTLPSTVTIPGVTATEDSAVGTDGLQTVYEARSTQKAAVDEGDAVIPVATLNGEQVPAGYNYTNQNNRVEETDPVSTHHIEDTVVAVTNGADGTYEYYIDMDDFSNLGLQLTLSGGSGTCTVTIEATIQDDGTAPSSCTYVDVTNDAYGVVSYTATDMLNDSAGFFGQFKYVKVKVVAATGAADDADWTIYSKRKY